MITTRALVTLALAHGLLACSGSSSVAEGSGGSGGASGGGQAGTGGSVGGSSGRGGSSGKGGSSGSASSTGGSSGKASGGSSGTGTGGSAGTADDGGEAGTPAGGSGAAAGSGGSGGIPLANAPTEVATAACAKLFECCTATELMNLSLVGQSEPQCRLAVATLLELYSADLDDSVAAGRAAYDGVTLAECVSGYESRSCGMLPTLSDVSRDIGCPGAITPLVPVGEACGAHVECIDGYCDGGTGAATATGTCAQKKPDGAMCGVAEECEGGACASTGCGTPSDMPICAG